MTDENGDGEEKWREWARGWLQSIERTAVIVGAVAGVAALTYSLMWRDADLYTAFIRALVAGGLTMIVIAVAAQLWRGKKVKQAGLSPTGPEITFDQEISKATDQINERINDHIAMINPRLFDLERAVFKEGDASADPG